MIPFLLSNIQRNSILGVGGGGGPPFPCGYWLTTSKLNKKTVLLVVQTSLQEGVRMVCTSTSHSSTAGSPRAEC